MKNVIICKTAKLMKSRKEFWEKTIPISKAHLILVEILSLIQRMNIL